MPSKTATVKIREDGRCTIPIEAREALGIEGEQVYAELDIRVDGNSNE